MSGIKDQSKLTKGKGFKLVKDVVKTIGAPFTHAANFTSSTLSGLNRKNKKRGGKV